MNARPGTIRRCATIAVNGARLPGHDVLRLAAGLAARGGDRGMASMIGAELVCAANQVNVVTQQLLLDRVHRLAVGCQFAGLDGVPHRMRRGSSNALSDNRTSRHYPRRSEGDMRR